MIKLKIDICSASRMVVEKWDFISAVTANGRKQSSMYHIAIAYSMGHVIKPVCIRALIDFH